MNGLNSRRQVVVVCGNEGFRSSACAELSMYTKRAQTPDTFSWRDSFLMSKREAESYQGMAFLKEREPKAKRDEGDICFAASHSHEPCLQVIVHLYVLSSSKLYRLLLT